MSNIEMGIGLIIEMSRLSTGYLFMLSDNRGPFRCSNKSLPIFMTDGVDTTAAGDSETGANSSVVVSDVSLGIMANSC